MNYKSIIRVVGVVIVAVVFCVGCSEKPDEPDDIIPADTTKNPTGGGNGLLGDWSLVSEEVFGDIYHNYTSDDYKIFYSFKSSDDLLTTGFSKISDFWIESTGSAKYRVKGDSVCWQYLHEVGGEGGYDEYCGNYSISGNTLVIRSEMERTTFDVEADSVIIPTVLHQMTFVRDSLANARRLLSNVYRQDTALAFTDWMRPSESGTIFFAGSWFDDFDNVYTSNDSYWYTEGTRLTLVELECDKWSENGFYYCGSYSVIRTVTLDYQLTNGTLRLKAPGKDWDTWTPRDNYMYKSKAKSQKDRRHVNPFKVSWK
jgi:hypothetical protein